MRPTVRRLASKTSFQTTMLATPVSSSWVRKVTPLAVPGRCRTSTMPALRSRTPSRASPTRAALATLKCPVEHLHRHRINDAALQETDEEMVEESPRPAV